MNGAKMSYQFLQKMLDDVITLVGRVASTIKDKSFTVTEKHRPENIVTSSDITSQRMLIEGLRGILPSCGFFCEEEGVCSDGEYVWVIDPIDGTANYSRGIDDCAISVALLHRGRVVLGVVRSIFREECYSALLGGGAWLNGQPIRVSARRFEEGMLCTAMSLYKKEHAKACSDIIYEAYMQCNDIRRFGSCAMELCYMAAGRCELYFEIRVFPWDYAAALLILTEAGGIARELADRELDFKGPTVMIGANSRESYDRLAEIVNRHIISTPYED